MEGRKCSRKSQRNRMNNSIRYAVKGAFETAGKLQYCYSLTVRKDGATARPICRFPGKKKNGGCAIIGATNLCSRFL